VTDQLTRIFDRAPIGLYRSHEDGRLLYCNAAFVRLLGYPNAEALYAASMERDVYADPEDRQRLVASYRPGDVLDGVQTRWKRLDGSEITVVLYGHVISDDRGVTFEASVLDATHLVATAAQLRRQAEELERTATTLDLVVRQMPAVYWVMDRDLRITRTGGAVAEVLGYPLDTHIGRTLYEVHAMEPGDSDAITPHVRGLQGEIVTFSNEYRGRMLENTIGPYRIDGEIIGVIGTAVDVTASRILERRMVDAQRAESLGVLAGGLAHDFNNLLVAILGNADLALRDVPRGTPGRASIENIRTASLRAAELTDQLLAYAGRGVASTTAVSPRPLVEELLRIAAPTFPDNVGTRVDIPDQLVLRGDPTAVRQAVLNLIGNARDAIGPRGGAIAISARPITHDGSTSPDDALTAAPGAYVLLEVADDGPGMDADTRRRIFEPFFTTKASGHGLGLAAVMGIVRSHGGGLRVASEPGAGARFQVLWPASARAATDAEELASGSSAELRAAARTVLVVDDEDLVRDVVARMVEDLGYGVLTAADGPTALAIVAAQRVDCVLVDLTMPLMSGGEVVAQLRISHPELPIVLVSGYDRDRRGPVAANAYLAKPFRMDMLESTLAALLRPVS
jgi:PAS domain S-box-containing protein